MIILYYGKYASENKFPQCEISRYRTDQVKTKVPRKVLPYILVIPRLQRLFKCEIIAQFMDYHEHNKSGDGALRMHVYRYAFSEIEGKLRVFKDKPRDVSLSLEVDDVNPFGEIRSIYSMGPIFVIDNNIPPRMSINREHMMLEMIVLGI